MASPERRARRFKVFLIIALCAQLVFSLLAANYFRNRVKKLETRVERALVPGVQKSIRP